MNIENPEKQILITNICRRPAISAQSSEGVVCPTNGATSYRDIWASLSHRLQTARRLFWAVWPPSNGQNQSNPAAWSGCSWLTVLHGAWAAITGQPAIGRPAFCLFRGILQVLQAGISDQPCDVLPWENAVAAATVWGQVGTGPVT